MARLLVPLHVSFLALSGLLGCAGGDDPPHHDDDGDGFSVLEGDCDDQNPRANPATVELCDGWDNDCDDQIDEAGALDAPTWYGDDDGDGYGGELTTTAACGAPDGAQAEALDCDDTDPAINLDAIELCDGADNDCDGEIDEAEPQFGPELGPADTGDPGDPGYTPTWYIDHDGDGYGVTDYTAFACTAPDGFSDNADDCDDSNPLASPAGVEVCGDGADNDCDGYGGLCLEGELLLDETADATWLGSEPDAFAGDVVAGAGDLNGDGYDDALVGAPRANATGTDKGATFVIFGRPSGESDLASADGILVGESNLDNAGASAAGVGDVDGDGFDDLLIGAPHYDGINVDSGAAYLVLGEPSGTASLGTASARLVGLQYKDFTGAAVAAPGDHDGNGHADLFIGAYGMDPSGPSSGGAYLVHGPITGVLNLAEAALVLEGSASDERAGQALDGAGDLNGDGDPDLILGAPGSSSTGDEAGAAFVFQGPLLGRIGTQEADAVLVGERDGDLAGTAVAGVGDVDGDGYDDLFVGAPGQQAEPVGVGLAYLVLGPVSDRLDLATADAILLGEEIGDQAGYTLDGAGDVDGDGSVDLVVGAPGSDASGVHSGSVYLVLGPVTGSFGLGSSHARIRGHAADIYAGTSVAGAGDLDGDGFGDLLIGAPEDSRGALRGGSATALMARGLGGRL